MNHRRVLVGCVLAIALIGCGGPEATPQREPAAPRVTEAPAPPEQDLVDEAPVAPPPEEAPAAPLPAATPEEASAEISVAEAPAPEAPDETAIAVNDATPGQGEQAVEGGVPKAVVDEPVFNYGTRGDDETVTHEFVLRNEGTGILNIKSVRASCGCTTTELPTNVLAPGEEVKIEAATNLRGRQGAQRMAITLVTDDPEHSSMRLMLEGDVVASIMIEPRNINFGRIADDEPREETVTIKSTKDDLTFSVISAELRQIDFIEHEIKEVEPGKAFEIIVRTTGDVPSGNHSDRMIIRTDARERAVLWLPISMQVVGALEIMPPVLNIRYNDAPDAVTQQQLRISAGRVQQFDISEVVVPIEDMEATLRSVSDSEYTLLLANMPTNEALEGKHVILRTNIPNHEEVKIPFNIMRPRQPVRRQ